MLRYLLVDEYWSHIGEFVAEIPDGSVGMQVVLDDGRPFAIVAIVPNPAPDAKFAATWNAPNGPSRIATRAAAERATQSKVIAV